MKQHISIYEAKHALNKHKDSFQTVVASAPPFPLLPFNLDPKQPKIVNLRKGKGILVFLKVG